MGGSRSRSRAERTSRLCRSRLVDKRGERSDLSAAEVRMSRAEHGEVEGDVAQLLLAVDPCPIGEAHVTGDVRMRRELAEKCSRGLVAGPDPRRLTQLRLADDLLQLRAAMVAMRVACAVRAQVVKILKERQGVDTHPVTEVESAVVQGLG